MDQAGKIKFSSHVHLPSINKMLQYRYACLILCSIGEVIIFEHGCYFSALEQFRKLILSNYVLLASINIIYMYGHAWVI